MTRPQAKHLDEAEIDALVLSSDRGASSEPASESILFELQRHVESCEDCNRKVQMHKQAQGELVGLWSIGPVGSHPNCPREDNWAKVAAGLLPETEIKELVNHAAQCDHCGPLLRSAADIIADETTPEEETVLAGLRSTQPRWQQNLVERLQRNVRVSALEKPATSRWPQVLRWPRPAYALAGFAVIVATTWLGMRAFHTPSADQLLAHAYSDHRTVEVRIVGAKYAPLRVERGGAGSSLDKPAAL